MTSSKPSTNIIYVTAPQGAHEGTLSFQGREFPCALGRTGIIEAQHKAEGDGATPQGTWALRELFFRSDKIPQPETSLPVHELKREDGWCDAAQDIAYNQHVSHPYQASAEKLWREDHLYDLIVPLGYNDDPVIAGKGSAIFFHVLKRNPGTSAINPTEGCVALDLENLLSVLKACSPTTTMHIEESINHAGQK